MNMNHDHGTMEPSGTADSSTAMHDGTMQDGISDEQLLDGMMANSTAISHNDMDHSSMDHSSMDHSGMDHSTMDPSGMTDGNHMSDGIASGSSMGHVHEAASSSNSNAFCSGEMGMVMFMEGFQWALKSEGTCINLFFPGWTLNTKGKFVGAMFGVFILAITIEAISKLRHDLSGKLRKGTVQRSEFSKISIIQTVLHGIHAFIGYILMLAAMTFSLEFLISVICGLVVGYVWLGGDTYSHVTTNPCCAFLEDEVNERNPDRVGGLETQGKAQLSECCQTKECCQTMGGILTVVRESESEASSLGHRNDCCEHEYDV